jgi:hypothetical protein
MLTSLGIMNTKRTIYEHLVSDILGAAPGGPASV